MREWKNRMRIWRSQRSHFTASSLILLLQVRRLLFESFRSSLIQFFSVVLDVRHIPIDIVVLIQYHVAWENVVSGSTGESHEHGRIA